MDIDGWNFTEKGLKTVLSCCHLLEELHIPLKESWIETLAESGHLAKLKILHLKQREENLVSLPKLETFLQSASSLEKLEIEEEWI